MNKFFLIFLLLTASHVNFRLQAQNPLIDSLIHVSKTAKEDAGKVNILNKLNKQLWKTGSYEEDLSCAEDAKK